MAHVGDIGGAPVREVERLEDRAAPEHVAHVGNIGGVPAREVERLEAKAAPEYVAHVGDIGGVPAREVERLEARAAVEHVAHVGDIGGVPARDIERLEARAVPEHVAHVGDIGGVHISQVHARATGEIVEQLVAVAREAHLVGGGDACDRRFCDLAAPLVVLVELTPEECQHASGAVEGVSCLKDGGHCHILCRHLKTVAHDGIVAAAIGEGGGGDGIALWRPQRDFRACGVVIDVVVCDRRGWRGRDAFAQDEAEDLYRPVVRGDVAVVGADVGGGAAYGAAVIVVVGEGAVVLAKEGSHIGVRTSDGRFEDKAVLHRSTGFIAHDSADVAITGDAGIGKDDVFDGGAVNPAEQSLVLAWVTVSGLVEPYAADGVPLAIEGAAEVLVAAVEVAADGGEVLVGVAEAYGAVGDVVAQHEVGAAVGRAALHRAGQGIELRRGGDDVGAARGAAAAPGRNKGCAHRGIVIGGHGEGVAFDGGAAHRIDGHLACGQVVVAQGDGSVRGVVGDAVDDDALARGRDVRAEGEGVDAARTVLVLAAGNGTDTNANGGTIGVVAVDYGAATVIVGGEGAAIAADDGAKADRIYSARGAYIAVNGDTAGAAGDGAAILVAARDAAEVAAIIAGNGLS